MKFLLVEDDDNKRDDIKRFLDHEYPGSEIAAAASFQSALKSLLTGRFDWVLLDMTIPTFDKAWADSPGRLRPLGGADLLDQMYRRGISGRIIVVTGYDMLGDGDAVRPLNHVVDGLRLSFPELLVGAVFYSRAEERWKDELKQLISVLPTAQGGLK